MTSFSIAGVLRRWNAETPEAPALTYEGRTTTWAEHHGRAARVAQALAAEGVGSQDRVAFIDKNGPEYFEVLFGGGMLNAVGVAVNWRLAPPEMAYVINDAEAKVLVVGAEFLGHLAAFEDQIETVGKIVVIGGGHDKHEPYDAWMGRQDPVDPDTASQPDDVAMQLYTSGTTGLPKGVLLTNQNLGGLLDEGAAVWGELLMDTSSVNLVAMPLFHIGGSGWALVGLAYGARSVVVREVDPAAILHSFVDEGVTHAFLVPAVLMFLLGVPGVQDMDFSKLRAIAYGASPITEKVLRTCIATFGCRFLQLYGLTETTGAVVMLGPEDHDPDGPRSRLLRSAGKAMPGVELRIVDQTTGQQMPVGTVGEIQVRSPQNMKGYWHKDDETRATVSEDGWLRTGDAGYVDDEGYLYLHDRVKDMVVSGGENVYPAEVENVLMSHPDVADVAVIGVPSERWGETVKAIVVKAPGADPEPDALIAYSKERLARYKCPTSVDFVDALPRNPSGKVLKRELREPYWAGHARRIN